MFKCQPIQWSEFIKIILLDSLKERKNDFTLHWIVVPFGQCTHRHFRFFTLLCYILFSVAQNCNEAQEISQSDVSGQKELEGRFLGRVGSKYCLKEKNIQIIHLANQLYFQQWPGDHCVQRTTLGSSMKRDNRDEKYHLEYTILLFTNIQNPFQSKN